jgi:hypothetical protein
MRTFCYFFASLFIVVTARDARAQRVYGAIADKWRLLGAATGPLGAPTSDESDAARGGRFNTFQNGFIYWHRNLGEAHAVYGLIGQKWNALGREKGFGYPLTDEQPAKNGGRFNDFENGGSIYFHPTFGVHAVYGAIRAKWHELGREAGALGYPLSDETTSVNGGRFVNFQFGVISWLSNRAYAVYGRIAEHWITTGREQGVCGYPTSDEYDFDDGRDTGEYGYWSKRFRRSDFNGGYILWSKKRDTLYPYCGASPPPPPKLVSPPPPEACLVSVVITNKSCLNPDGSPMSNWPPGSNTTTGCGSNVENARARARQTGYCISDADQASPGCCTISEQVAQGCLCRPPQ